jgi:hypothetical protein
MQVEKQRLPSATEYKRLRDSIDKAVNHKLTNVTYIIG